jgi:predicted RND superfamily exporter protein
MVISLPIAIILTILIVGLALRSVRYSIVTVIPILLVVAWVFGYMWLRGITINVITATIGAIAVGAGNRLLNALHRPIPRGVPGRAEPLPCAEARG